MMPLLPLMIADYAFTFRYAADDAITPALPMPHDNMMILMLLRRRLLRPA